MPSAVPVLVNGPITGVTINIGSRLDGCSNQGTNTSFEILTGFITPSGKVTIPPYVYPASSVSLPGVPVINFPERPVVFGGTETTFMFPTGALLAGVSQVFSDTSKVGIGCSAVSQTESITLNLSNGTDKVVSDFLVNQGHTLPTPAPALPKQGQYISSFSVVYNLDRILVITNPTYAMIPDTDTGTGTGTGSVMKTETAYVPLILGILSLLFFMIAIFVHRRNVSVH
jgi:hypothetical protein